MNKSILVTGGAGYIGSHTCKLLSNFGFQPVTYDNLSNGHRELVKWGPLVVGDLGETQKLVETMMQYKPLAVIHFAANAYVGESILNPLKYYKNNVGGTLSLLEAMKIVGISKMVFSSTCATYGTPVSLPISESTPQMPINPYGESKLIIEKVMFDLSKRKELDYVSLRYFNAAGADRDAEIGEFHEPETHLIPLAIRSALDGETLNINGGDFQTIDGTAIRDYVHVEDLANGHLGALKYLISGGASDVFNLGTGKGTSVLEVIHSLEKMGIVVKYSVKERRPGDPACLVANADKAAKILGWKPEYLDISKILKTAIAWHLRNQ